MTKHLKIDVLTNDGSPLNVCSKDIYGENGRIGVGGAELALLTMCEAWHNFGHEVRLYNNPTTAHGSPFQQYPIDTFIPQEDRDILLIFRSPNRRIIKAKGKKIWWSTDQFTVGDFRDFSTWVDEIVTISPFHSAYFRDRYGIEKNHVIDLPVRLEDYEKQIPKIKHRMIYCSIPDRGLHVLAQAYPRIKQAIPDATLTVTSDYRLWGTLEPRNEQHIRRFFGMDGVRFLGAVPRRELVQEQLQADVQAYPCTYDELFCYSVAECQVAGAYPITSTQGALATTNMGVQVVGEANNPHWIKHYADTLIENMISDKLEKAQQELREIASQRFSLANIMKNWDMVFNV